MQKTIRIIAIGCFLAILTACIPKTPSHVQNICDVFMQYPKWYYYAKKSAKRWGVPVAVQMAIIYQESRFNATAKPPRTHLLWVIPWSRESSSYGYTQALKETWERYESTTGDSADRDGFAASTDFIGWFGYQAYRKAKIPRDQAYYLYLAYHEGIGGYQSRSYLHKKWLIDVAHHVSYRAQVYQQQLDHCANDIPSHFWWGLF